MLSLTNSNIKNLSKEVRDVSGQSSTDIKKRMKKPVNDAEMVTKKEIMESMGIVDSLIKDNLEISLQNINYNRKTKMQITDEVCNDLEKQVEKLKYQRLKILMVIITLLI